MTILLYIYVKNSHVCKYFYRYLCDSCFIVEEKEIEEERKKMTWGEQAKETINKQPQLFPKDKFEFKEAEESDTTQYI